MHVADALFKNVVASFKVLLEVVDALVHCVFDLEGVAPSFDPVHVLDQESTLLRDVLDSFLVV